MGGGVYSIRFDMRAPSFGASGPALYAAAIEMSAWAENNSCWSVVLCEHHGADDGYLPAPLLLASAIAARTDRVPLLLTIVLPFYDPVRLAEDIGVLDLISNGRASYVLGLGYRSEEFAHFGLNKRHRGSIADQKLAVLRRLLAGEVVTVADQHTKVTPLPASASGPSLMWGGGSAAAARRAGRYGLGYLAQGDSPGAREAYETACAEHDHNPGMLLLPARDTPTVCFIADDVDAAWNELGPYLLHDAVAYAKWNPDNQTSAGISQVSTVEGLREDGRSHQIFTVEEAQDFVRAGGLLTLSPLCGGLPPSVGWPYLERAARAIGRLVS